MRSEPVTSEELAIKAMFSQRTIKSDISYLNRVLMEEGTARIVSLKARGYHLESLDAEKYQRLCEDTNVQYTLFQERSIERTNRQLYILQTLLTERYVKLEALCDTLFLSRSALAEDISWATRFFLSYNLKVVSVSGKGLHTEGLEQDIRSVMVEVFCSQYHDIELLYPVKGFSQFFYDDRCIYEDIRHEFLKILRESKISVTDISSKKLATHLCLIRSRSLSGKHPDLPAGIVEELRKSYEYGLAQEVFANNTIHAYLNVKDESEILNFARILIINRDVDLRSGNDLDTLPAYLMIENSRIFDEIVNEMRQETGGTFFTMELFRFCSIELESMQMGLYLKHHYDHTCKQRVVTYNEGVEKQVSPLSLELTRLMVEKVKQRFGEEICGGENKAYAAAFDFMLSKIDYSYHKLRLATVSTDSKIVADLMREELSRYYGEFIEHNDVFELYEMRRINFSDYDAIVISWGSLYLSYPIPFIRYGTRRTEPDHRQRMFRELFFRGFSQRRLEEIKKITHCYEHLEINNYYSFIQALSYKYGVDDVHQKRILDHIMDRSQILSYYYSNSGVSLLFLDYCDTQREFIDVYLPQKTICWQQSMEISSVIVVSMNPATPVQDVKLTDRLLQMLANDRFLVQKLVKTPNQTLEDLFYRAMEERFAQ